MKFEDLTGKKKNNLTIIGRLPNIYKKVTWKALCDCGNFTTVTSGDFKRTDKRQKKSCGCLLKRTGKDSPIYKGYKEISGKYWAKLKTSALKRNIDFDLDIEFISKLFYIQNKKCNLSGVDLIMNVTASLDRINSSLGYVRGNVQWLHKDINKLKSTFNQEYLIEMCHKISKNKKL